MVGKVWERDKWMYDSKKITVNLLIITVLQNSFD